MFDIQNYASFVLAVLVFQLVPGAGTIAILNATARNGTAAGMAAVAGTLAGDFVFMAAAVAGLAAIMRANPLLFEALQWFGAAYLCWIGISLLRSRVGPAAQATEPKRAAWSYFRQAFAVSLTNPKVILFFVSFFPLFLRPSASTMTLAAMMLHVTLLSLAYQAALVLAGNAVARRLASIPAARRIATRLAGAALVGFGIKLAADNR
jgi:threonine/homoserine/homoserine lactone efflux protein